MTFTAKNYRQFAHDLLNVAGRIQSVAELVEIDDETLRNMLNNDVKTLTRSIKLFSKLGWCQAQSELEETHLDLCQRRIALENVPCAIDMEICCIEQTLAKEYAKLGISMTDLPEKQKEAWK